MTKSHSQTRAAALLRARLYLLLNLPVTPGRSPVELALAAVAGGVDMVQVRWKGASRMARTAFVRTLRQRFSAAGCDPLIVLNDDLDGALAAGADGVHLGQGDRPVEEARRQAGGALLVGLSTHSTLQARGASGRGADYVGFGAMFETDTKQTPPPIGPELLKGLEEQARLPVFAIGGITLGNLDQVLAAGCRRVAVSAAILKAKDPCAAARAFHERLWARP